VDDPPLAPWLAAESEDLDALWRHVLRRGIELRPRRLSARLKLAVGDRRYAGDVRRVTG
jgi:hypothetical protein